MVTILISGGTGEVGKALMPKLKAKGYDVAILSRTNHHDNDILTYYWDIDKNIIDKEAMERADYIIHLAGANIGEKKWTSERKQLIIDSRVKSGRLIFETAKNVNHKLKAFISASAIGYYGAITADHVFTEKDPPSNDFLGITCQKWEETADLFETLQIRTVKIRTGVVMTKQNGALAKMITPVKLYMGGAIGNGRQYLPWIHIDDLCGIYIKAIEDEEMKGAYNAVAPEHITNGDFTKTLARILNKPIWLPNVPAFIMKIIFGKK
ncbi:MAG: TIGR01777 family protein, partial [Bacteroidetes bacterium]|nr:TIGR01777 family protein [Bacteroidota bacterium]